MSAARRLHLVGSFTPSPIVFSQGSGFTQAEQQHLSQFLQFHPHGQAVADEVAGQLRARGRGPQGVRSPRGLAVRLARVAMEQGIQDWYFHEDEAALRAQRVQQQAQPAPLASAAVRARALEELQSIKARHLAARLAQGGEQ